MPLQAQFLLFLSAGALCCDLFLQKVPNLWIFLGILLGFSYQIFQNGFFGLLFSLKNFFLPILILFPLFIFHAMGAGDLKLFGTLGIFLNFSDVFSLIAFSFFIGALISCLLFLSSAYFLERISYFFSYISDIFSKKQIHPYMKSGNRPEHFHFTVPIFLATLLLIGGFCL